MAQFNVQIPYVVREALPVAQTVAKYVYTKFSLIGPDREKFPAWADEWEQERQREIEKGQGIPYAPMNISLKYDEKREDPVLPHCATVRIFFAGGLDLRIHFIGGDDNSYGEYWYVEKIHVRYFVCEVGRGNRPTKDRAEWKGKDLTKISQLWGNSPPVKPPEEKGAP